jgi:hypothetical protein
MALLLIPFLVVSLSLLWLQNSSLLYLGIFSGRAKEKPNTENGSLGLARPTIGSKKSTQAWLE